MPIAAVDRQREKGAIPASIGTSLAIESLGGFGEYPQPKPPIRQYTELWINLRTIIRNVIGSFQSAEQLTLLDHHLYDYIVEDLLAIQASLQHICQSAFPIVLYWCDFKTLREEFTLAQWREVKAPRQIALVTLESDTIALILKKQAEFEVITHLKLYRYQQKLTRPTNKGDASNVLILTHYPIDLLSKVIGNRVTLIESHTGQLKTRGLWYTKLTNGKKFIRIPFNRMTLQVFGDNGLLFSPMPKGIKDAVHTMAEKDQWTPVTTDERVRASIQKLYDPREKVFFLKLLSG